MLVLKGIYYIHTLQRQRVVMVVGNSARSRDAPYLVASENELAWPVRVDIAHFVIGIHREG